MALPMTNNIDQTPCPNKVNIGPGQAPVIAHPKPKIVPPIKYLGIEKSLEVKIIVSPDKVLPCTRLMELLDSWMVYVLFEPSN